MCKVFVGAAPEDVYLLRVCEKLQRLPGWRQQLQAHKVNSAIGGQSEIH